MFKKKKKQQLAGEDAMYMEGQGKLIWRKFKKHKLAMVGFVILVILYTPVSYTHLDVYKRQPIEERLPDEPAVVEVDEIGVYGGTYVGAAFGPTSGQVDTEGLRFQSLLTIEEDLNTFKPNIIKGYDVNEDYTEYTIHLREGMKWSNGEVV